MKVLIFGPSGSGKTYVSNALHAKGINAFDADDIPGLFAWYNRSGKKIPEPSTADEAIAGQYAFLWSKKAMAKFLGQYSDVFVFGGSGNITSVFDLFDKVYFLHVDPALQKERLLSPSRPAPQMDKNNGEIIIWGGWFEDMARAQNIPFIDASLSPEEIYELIRR